MIRTLECNYKPKEQSNDRRGSYLLHVPTKSEIKNGFGKQDLSHLYDLFLALNVLKGILLIQISLINDRKVTIAIRDGFDSASACVFSFPFTFVKSKNIVFDRTATEKLPLRELVFQHVVFARYLTSQMHIMTN